MALKDNYIYARFKQMKNYAKKKGIVFGFQNFQEFEEWAKEKEVTVYDKFVRDRRTEGYTKENLMVIENGNPRTKR